MMSALLLMALAISFVVVLLMYAFGKAIAPKPPKSKQKLEPYACGEYFPPARGPLRILFFNFATLFLAFDVISMFLAFTMGTPPEYKHYVLAPTLLYCAILALAVYLLMRR